MKVLSGKFVLRISGPLHGALKKMAFEKDLSLNQVCESILSEHMQREGRDQVRERLGFFQKRLVGLWPKNVVGLVLFGSVVRGDVYESSDVDLMIVVEGMPLSRGLYKTWDDEVDDELKPQVNPHFVVLPRDVKSVGSLWFEVMQEGVVLWERENKVSSFLDKLKKKLKGGKLKRTEAHGHPYWVREEHA